MISSGENKKTQTNTHRWVRLRIILVAFFITLAMSIVPFRVAYLKYRYKNRLLQTLQGNTEGTLKVEPRRGNIYDSSGRELAISVRKESLYADTREIDNPDIVARSLARILHAPKGLLKKKLKSGKSFVWVKRNLSALQREKVAALKISGLHFKHEYTRVYPYGEVAGQVLGFTGVDGHGLEGAELFYDPYLRGETDNFNVLWDALRKPIARSGLPGTNPDGNSLWLTIDAKIQFCAEKELRRAIERYQADSGEVIVMDPNTGAILAMAVYPFFNPNAFRYATPDRWRNRAITDSFEPGSTFKIVLFASALETKLFKTRDIVYCENGSLRVSTHIIHDVHPRGWLTVADVLKYSSNIGAVKIGERLGRKRFYSWIKRFGFGEKTGIDLPGEARGVVRGYRKWTKVDMAAACFGQGIAVTPLQMTLAMAYVANGGKKVVPHVMKKITSPEGEVIKRFRGRPKAKIMKPSTSRCLKRLLVRVVEDGGTGIRAAIDGYSVAGKTGTSQSYDEKTCSYDAKKGTASFVGFAPSDEPKFVVGVFIHNPRKACYGGVVSGPVFREVCERALLYAGIPPNTRFVKGEINIKTREKEEFTRVSKLAITGDGLKN